MADQPANPWVIPVPLMTGALIDRIKAAYSLGDDSTTDTPAARDLRNLLAFVAYVALAAKMGEVNGNPDRHITDLFDPAVLNVELP
jgi:hypothetical protein